MQRRRLTRIHIGSMRVAIAVGRYPVIRFWTNVFLEGKENPMLCESLLAPSTYWECMMLTCSTSLREKDPKSHREDYKKAHKWDRSIGTEL